MKIGIVLFPSKSYQDQINMYRKRYDAHYSLIAPHITLKDAFEVNEEELKEVTSKLESIASECAPVEINVEKVSNFAPTKNVIYLKVTPNERLNKIFDALNDGTFHGVNQHPFVPHFTIAQGLTSQEFEDIKAQLSMVDVKHSEIIDRISLCYQLENGQWNVSETFKLQN